MQARFGAIGKSGSIALIERFWSTLKREGMRKLLVPYGGTLMREELRVFCLWCNRAPAALVAGGCHAG